ncbi:MAG TPA: ISAzo13 family transposase [Anaerolineae bacterium]|nr:ISAzo13 family transposase [Anaerolineae bacterium]
MLDQLLKDNTAGHPITGLKWTRKTLRQLSWELLRKGLPVGYNTIRRLLKDQGYALRANRKRLTKERNPNRDHQMRYIARLRRAFQKAGKPAISVDAKKRELVGNFKNAGRTWRQRPFDVLETDFRSEAKGIAILYGIYDSGRNAGYMVVGVSHETAEFAVAAVRAWWLEVGCQAYPRQPHLLIQADDGGSNDSRSWLWKACLQELADECQLTITVTHYPAGASKWNLIEHGLFCFISLNWAGQPLVSYETILNFIRTTRTKTGLTCRARLDRKHYETGLKVGVTEKANINLKPHRLFPNWNYTIAPRSASRKK